jgi:molybdenum cofactor cytidylyltransferase
MGRPKQLLPIGNKPLLRHVAKTALSSPVHPIIVVLGSNAAGIRSCLNELPVHVVVNEGWPEGMGSSVRVGVGALTELSPTTNGVILALGDQPRFSAAHVARLLETHRQTGRTIVASQYRGDLQPPAFFAARHFNALLALKGERGARSLFQMHADEVAAVAADGLHDLDTLTDYADFLKDEKNLCT